MIMSEKSGSRSQAVSSLEYHKGPKNPSRRRLVIGGSIIAGGLGLTSLGIDVFGGDKKETPNPSRNKLQDSAYYLLKDPNVNHYDYQIKDDPVIRRLGAAERDAPNLKGQGEGLPSNELGRLQVGEKLRNSVTVIGQPVLLEVGKSRDDEWIAYIDREGRVGFVHGSNVERIPPEKPLQKI